MLRKGLVSTLLAILLMLTACQTAGQPTNAQPTAPEETGGAFRVALVLPSKINDMSFSQSMYDALVNVQKAMGPQKFQFVYSEDLYVVDDASAAIRSYASQGYNLVIAHGSQYGSSLVDIAPDFPKTSFAWGTTVDTFTDKGIKNVFAYEARAEEGGYVNGVIAAMLSKTGIVGAIGPIETGDDKLYLKGFEAGVKATKPDATVNTNWTGSYSDASLASAAAQAHINAGADVLTGTAQMVVGAIGVAKDKNVAWLGNDASQMSLAPNNVVADQIYKWDGVLKQMISLIQGGTLGGRSFAINLKNGGEVIELNQNYNLAGDVKNAAQKAIQDISDGTINIDVGN
jgi:basic membrane protein A